jgi:cytochrome bd ubiquinol oxidase subunit II
MSLAEFWFIIIAVLWIGYFVLEGFDFGVGNLLFVLGKNDRERRLLINTIGPVWDGNEVWLLVAGGATFAALPEGYATLFSGFYLPLLLILVALIVRGVAFEYRGKRHGDRWGTRWDALITVGSFVPSLLWGVAFANIVAGVPIEPVTNNMGRESLTYTGTFFTLLNPYALLGGVVTLLLCTMHGANFLALKTSGDMRDRAHGLVLKLGIASAVAAVIFLGWTLLGQDAPASAWVTTVLAAVALIGSIVMNQAHRDGWAFTLTAFTLGLAVITLFLTLYPDVMPSSVDPAYSLTIENASSTAYTLKVMTIVALILTPIVLIYQSWTFWVFRRRLSLDDIPLSEAEKLEAQTQS